MSYKPGGKKTNKQGKNQNQPPHPHQQSNTCKMLGFSLGYISQRRRIAVLEDSLLPFPWVVALQEGFCQCGCNGGSSLETSPCHHVSLLIPQTILTCMLSSVIKYMKHSIQKGLELRKNKFKGVSKINPVNPTPFTAIVKRWEESSNSNREIIWQWIRIYSDSIQIHFDERECNYWCSCHIWGKYFIFSSSILLSLCSD